MNNKKNLSGPAQFAPLYRHTQSIQKFEKTHALLLLEHFFELRAFVIFLDQLYLIDCGFWSDSH